MNHSTKYGVAKSILSVICSNHSHNLSLADSKEALWLIDHALSDDFIIDIDGNEYRVIAESAIWDIYVETIKELVNDCYDLKLDDIPSFIAFDINWERTATNTHVDGYGHTFSSYDGSECTSESINGEYYWVFRTN